MEFNIKLHKEGNIWEVSCREFKFDTYTKNPTKEVAVLVSNIEEEVEAEEC